MLRLRTVVLPLCFLFLALFVVDVEVRSDEAGGSDLSARLRRPIGLQLSQDEKWLYIANARSGSLSVLDVAHDTVVREIVLGGKLSDIKAAPDGRTLLITDEATHQLYRVAAEGAELSVRQKLRVAQYPVSVSVSNQGNWAVVASLWSHRLTFVELPAEPDGEALVTGIVDLPFAPRCQVLVRDDSQLVVADAFSSRLAVVDTVQHRLRHVRSFPSHNIRGLGVSPNGKMLLVVHQMLNELAHTTNNDVHWGLLMSNDLRWLPLESVLAADADLYRGAHMHPLGQAGNATGDPSGLAVTTNGRVIVSLGGVGEVAVGTENDFSLHRLTVGRRPTAVVATRGGEQAFVANTLADSVSIVSLGATESAREVPLGPTAELGLVDRGELLFFDASLSHDSWMSCHSCHTDGHSNSLLNDNFSDQSFGSAKRVLSLLGSRATAPYAWNGGVPTLADQVRNSITHTMQGDEPPSERQVESLVAFVQSLHNPPPLDVARDARDPAAVARGEQLFQSFRCQQCHAPPNYTTAKTYNVGLSDKQGNSQFNPPSLRGVSQRGPYFHDNRASSLEAVFSEFGHQLYRELTDDELRNLIAFLQSL